MANRSPPIPLLIGSTTPSAALAAIAASIADPPRAKTCAPACEASVWLVATIPCREITIDRASDLSCASEGIVNQMNRRPITAFRLFAGLRMELAIIADGRSLAPPPRTVISFLDRSHYESTRFLSSDFSGGRRHSTRPVPPSSLRRHSQKVRYRSHQAGSHGRASQPPGYGNRHQRLRRQLQPDQEAGPGRSGGPVSRRFRSRRHLLGFGRSIRRPSA